jgi:hypothetical protein
MSEKSPARRKSSDEVPISYLSPTLETTRLTVAMILSGSQKAFSVIAILPTSLWERLAQSLTTGFAGFRFLNRIDLGLERVEPGDCARNADQINRLLGPLNFSFDGRSVSRPAPRSFKLQDPGPNSSVDVGAGADCKQ